MRSILRLGVLIGLLPALEARAQSVDECIAAHEAGQRSERDNRLLEARKQFRTCKKASCPGLVREDCVARMQFVEKNIPTVVLKAFGKDVKVQIDDDDPAPLPSGPIELDPGPHEVVFLVPGQPNVARSVTLARGQTNVAVEADLTPVQSIDSTESPKSSTVPAATWVLSGVAVLGVAGFVGFGLSGNSKQSDLDSCKPSCGDPGLYDDMKSDYLKADIALGVALLAAGGAAYFYVNRDNGHRVGLYAFPEATALGYEGRFW